MDSALESLSCVRSSSSFPSLLELKNQLGEKQTEMVSKRAGLKKMPNTDHTKSERSSETSSHVFSLGCS